METLPLSQQPQPTTDTCQQSSHTNAIQPPSALGARSPSSSDMPPLPSQPLPEPSTLLLPIIGIYSIFMGQYKILLPDFVDNMRSLFLPSHPKIFYLITDDPELCDSLHATSHDIQCAVREVIGWPYESLYRWRYFLTSFDPLAQQDADRRPSHIFFFNSNARCLTRITQEEDGLLAPFTAVIHDLYEESSYAGMPFEKNPISTAYIPPMDHYRYYGAKFLGASTENFVSMCRALDTNTQIDETNNFIAVWHDESHYNHYINVVLDGEVREMGSEYHIPEEAPELVMARNVTGKILYLDKARLIPELGRIKGKSWRHVIGGSPRNHSYFTLPVFRPKVYRALNPDLTHMTDEELREDYVLHPRERPYFYETPAFAALFDAKAYRRKYNCSSELWAKYHFIHKGVWAEDDNFFVRGADPSRHVHITFLWQKMNYPKILSSWRDARVRCVQQVGRDYMEATEACRARFEGSGDEEEYGDCFYRAVLDKDGALRGCGPMEEHIFFPPPPETTLS